LGAGGGDRRQAGAPRRHSAARAVPAVPGLWSAYERCPRCCRVENVEPWMSGNARGPSTAFNLLYRLCEVCGWLAEVGGVPHAACLLLPPACCYWQSRGPGMLA
jgi:hypothetical protein